MKLLAVGLMAAVVAACAYRGVPRPGAVGVLVAEVSAEAGDLWMRAPGVEELDVVLEGPAGRSVSRVPIAADRAATVHHRWRGLTAGSLYRYRIQLPGSREPLAGGTFRSAPDPAAPAAVRFIWSGDLAGQNVCRDAERGFPIFRTMAASRPDFFIALGDMIYADGECRSIGRYGNPQVPGPTSAARTLDEFRERWIYTRDDPAFRAFLTRVPYFAVWDDHEVLNDFSPATAGASYHHGRRAFLEFTPIEGASPGALFRSFRWGRHLELFLLDLRSHRDANSDPDDGNKTMLGAAQKAWLIGGLKGSDATWKIVVSSVPIAIPTGHPPGRGRDGWADAGGDTGFESELQALFEAVAGSVANLVWITTDVHHATGFEYRPFPETPGWSLHEFVAGPLSAGVFPSRELDPTFNPERIFYHAPGADLTAYPDALDFFNFGLVEIDPEGWLGLSIVSARGTVIHRSRLIPRGESITVPERTVP